MLGHCSYHFAVRQAGISAGQACGNYLNPLLTHIGTTVTTDWLEGSEIRWKGEWKGRAYEDKGTILAIVPFRRLVYTHFSPLSGQPDVLDSYHTVTIALVPDGQRTEVTLTQDNNSTDETAFKDDLLNIARTTLSSKLLTYEKELFAKLAVDAVMRIKENGDLDLIQIIKKPGGTLKDSYLDEGFILEKQISIGCPRRVENARILLANTPMDYDKIKMIPKCLDTESKTIQTIGAPDDLWDKPADELLNKWPDSISSIGICQLVFNFVLLCQAVSWLYSLRTDL